MQQFLIFVRKEFYHVFRDRKTLLILFGLPVAQILLFGFALTNEIRDSKIAICDYAKDDASRKITDKIAVSSNFKIERNLFNYHQVETAFKEGKIKLAIIFLNILMMICRT